MIHLLEDSVSLSVGRELSDCLYPNSMLLLNFYTYSGICKNNIDGFSYKYQRTSPLKYIKRIAFCSFYIPQGCHIFNCYLSENKDNLLIDLITKNTR